MQNIQNALVKAFPSTESWELLLQTGEEVNA
ncbi:hypothetical protein CYA_2839 [Synechococcus sp. JA-3-3Ab]|nr:hypothetical protein CYA_2839 [Synechococcus sp. JA-3-3Ab]